jgi:lipopolysaccharide transport system permease protein
MAELVVAYQGILVNGQWPQWTNLWLVTVLAAVFCATGFRLFRKHVGEMVDEL